MGGGVSRALEFRQSHPEVPVCSKPFKVLGRPWTTYVSEGEDPWPIRRIRDKIVIILIRCPEMGKVVFKGDVGAAKDSIEHTLRLPLVDVCIIPKREKGDLRDV